MKISIPFLTMLTRIVLKNAQDVFQEALMVLNDKVADPGFKLTSNVCAFLSGTSYNKWLKILRHNKGKHFKPIDGIQLPYENESKEEKERMISKMEKALETLSELCRRVLHTYYHDEKSTKEIAEIERVPVNRVKQRLHGCRKQLQAILK